MSDSAERSSLRELIPSLPNTLPRCHSTVRGRAGQRLGSPPMDAGQSRDRFPVQALSRGSFAYMVAEQAGTDLPA